MEAWAAAGRLGVLRALIRQDDEPLPGGAYRGDLPEGWSKSLTHEVALALSVPAGSAERQMWLAFDLHARLPGIGALLAAGQLTFPVAKAVAEPFQLLTDQDAAAAEAMILPELPGKTYGQAQQLAVRAAVTVDPDAAARRRQDAERNRARVQLFREESGAAALSGRDLPAGQTLAAHASVCTRAAQYQDSGVFPRDTRMDQYRAAAYLDLLNNTTAEDRITTGQLVTATHPGADPGRDPDPGPDEGTPDTPGASTHGAGNPDSDEPDRNQDNGEPDDGEPDGSSSGGGGSHGGGGSGGGSSGGNTPGGSNAGGSGPGGPGGSGSRGPGPGGSAPGDARPPALLRPADLVLPLATLLGLAERPGEGHGLGPLDPDLCRELAAAAAASPLTEFCVTVTDRDGTTAGHGCAKARGARTKAASTQSAWAPPEPGPTARPLPARLNLTITADRLAVLAGLAAASSTGPPGRPGWSLTRTADPGPPGGYGTWVLTLPNGTTRTVSLEPVPVFDCDHRHQSHAYQPNSKLRHLVQVRDNTCTFPTCSRHAKDSDFEHAVPYDKGGRTCACNAGARSRACHRVKQSPGWTVTQPQPGFHQWETPAGRRYTQGPRRYPV